MGIIGDIVVGLIGAFIGDRLIPRLQIHLGTGVIALIFNAAIGAIVLLLNRWGASDAASWEASTKPAKAHTHPRKELNDPATRLPAD